MINITVLDEVLGSDCKAAALLQALCIKTNLSVKNNFLRFRSTWWKMLGGSLAEAGHTHTFEILSYSLKGGMSFSTLGGATGKAYSDVNQTFRWQVYSLSYKQIYYKIFYFLLNLRLKEKFWNGKEVHRSLPQRWTWPGFCQVTAALRIWLFEQTSRNKP